MNLAIDIGNTRVKAAVFEGDKLIELAVFEKKIIISEIRKILKKHPISAGIVSNVTSFSEKKMLQLKKSFNFMVVSASLKVPFNNLYKTPKTLGVDRIALVVAAVNQFPNKNVTSVLGIFKCPVLHVQAATYLERMGPARQSTAACPHCWRCILGDVDSNYYLWTTNSLSRNRLKIN